MDDIKTMIGESLVTSIESKLQIAGAKLEDENYRRVLKPYARGAKTHAVIILGGTVLGNIAMFPFHGLTLMVNTVINDVSTIVDAVKDKG